jgi:hypothetical protein
VEQHPPGHVQHDLVVVVVTVGGHVGAVLFLGRERVPAQDERPRVGSDAGLAPEKAGWFHGELEQLRVLSRDVADRPGDGIR